MALMSEGVGDPTGTVRRNPVTGSVAIRTTLPDEPDFYHTTWLVATAGVGSRCASFGEVADWEIIYPR